MWRVVPPLLALVFVVAVGFVNTKLMLVICLFAVGSVIATAVEKGPQFKPQFAFHKCCSAVQWALMSFYLYIFETLPKFHPDPRVYRAVGVLLLLTLGMYVFSTWHFQKLIAEDAKGGNAGLENTDPGNTGSANPDNGLRLFTTDEEKRSVAFAFWTLLFIIAFLLFARFRLNIIF